MKKLVEIDCEYCDGSGTTQVDSSINPDNEDITCVYCNGKGELTVDFDDYFNDEVLNLMASIGNMREKLQNAGFGDTAIRETIIAKTRELYSEIVG